MGRKVQVAWSTRKVVSNSNISIIRRGEMESHSLVIKIRMRKSRNNCNNNDTLQKYEIHYYHYENKFMPNSFIYFVFTSTSLILSFYQILEIPTRSIAIFCARTASRPIKVFWASIGPRTTFNAFSYILIASSILFWDVSNYA